MKLLVSTKLTQGFRSDDFSFTEDGELLVFDHIETNCGHDPDHPCGCARALCGVDSLNATTTMLVKDVEMSENQFETVIRESVARSGLAPDQLDTKIIAEDLIALAAIFDVGDVLDRSVNQYRVRTNIA
jgi:hypothetical protein